MCSKFGQSYQQITYQIKNYDSFAANIVGGQIVRTILFYTSALYSVMYPGMAKDGGIPKTPLNRKFSKIPLLLEIFLTYHPRLWHEAGLNSS